MLVIILFVLICPVDANTCQMLNDAYKKDLKKFDMERALPAFDGLIAKQQAVLTRLNVPTMSVSDDTELREVSSTCLLVWATLKETYYSANNVSCKC